MSTPTPQPPRDRGPLISWLIRVNSQLAQWVAAMSWWRLLLLFIIVMIAGSMISDKLGLHHERSGVDRAVKVKREGVHIKGNDGESVVVTIGGRDAIRITQENRSPGAHPTVPPTPPVPGATPGDPEAADAARSAASGPGPAASAATPATPAASTPDAEDEDIDLGDAPWIARRVVTFRGVLGDLGATILIVLFAYLIAAKVIVRKVAESDAKVRTAVDAAERETMERQLVQARLQVLQAQVEPHFLFNTLATVDYLIETDPPRASQMQKALIRYLRGALPQMRQESSTLGRELKLVQSYLELIKMRIEDRLEVDYAVPEGLQSAVFPPMMLQSLVENAIKHGIEPKPQGGKVSVAARIQNGQLWVEVNDTGVGLPDGDFMDGPTSGTGIGLRNIRERLAMLFPGKSRLSLRSDDTTGTSVKIAIPYTVAAGTSDETAPASGDAQA